MKALILSISLLITVASVQPASAQWKLNENNSHLSFVSIKNNAVAEVNRFESLSGAVTVAGEATVNIALDSIETNIPIRNDRMKTMLFQTGIFTQASVSTQLDIPVFRDLETGASISAELSLELNLHGIMGKVPAKVRVTRTQKDTWLVNSIQPLIINAPGYQLAEGIEALRNIAGLQSITPVIPVTFILEFTEQSAATE